MAGKKNKGVCDHVFIEKDYHECEYCNKQFTTAYNLNRHKKGNCRENVCSKCNLRFQKSDQLRNHLITCSGKQPHQCEFCAKSFMKNSNLTRHRQTHTEKCEKCGAIFYKRVPLISVYPNETYESCTHCDETFKTQEKLLEHIEGHLNQYSNKCETCALTFSKKRQLTKHIHKCHPELLKAKKNRKIYECPLCLRCFHLYRDLKMHLQTHVERGEKVYKCKTCGRGYSRKTTLRMHMIKHSKRENKPRCDICKKVFSHPYCLRAHMRIHSNTRPFSCSVCNKSFRQQGHLIRHRLTHGKTESDQTPQTCDICEKTFRDETALKIHLFVHNSAKRYDCEHCSKSFLSRKALVDHIKTHAESKSFVCPVCQEAFTHVDELHKHKQTHQSHEQSDALVPLFELNEHVQAVEMTNSVLDPGTLTLVDSVVLPVQMSLQAAPLSLHNQLQPIHNQADEILDPLALQQVQLQLQGPVNMVRAHQKSANDMPTTYWHLPQSNFVQYQQNPTTVDMKAPMFVNAAHNSMNLQASLAPSTIEMICSSMQQLQQLPSGAASHVQPNLQPNIQPNIQPNPLANVQHHQ